MKIIAKLIITTAAAAFFLSGPAFSNPQSYNIATTPEAAYFETEYNKMVEQANAAVKANGSSTSEAWVRQTVTKYVNKQMMCMGSEAPQDKLECKQNKEEFTASLVAAAKKSNK